MIGSRAESVIVNLGPSDASPFSGGDPDEARVRQAVERLAELDGLEADRDAWPEESWGVIEAAGATRWSLPASVGGLECPRELLLERYARLASGGLTATFILSQHDAAIRRLIASGVHPTAMRWLEQIAAGEAFVTIGVSHLTTSRRLGARAVRAEETAAGYRLDGAIPWVTGATKANMVVTGASLEDGRQILVALPTDWPGVEVRAPFELAALQASATTEIVLRAVDITREEVIAGPAPDLLSAPGAVGTAGLETSAIALGQARAALDALARLALDRPDLAAPRNVLENDWRGCWIGLIRRAQADESAPTPGDLRASANRLALRSSQALLTARKGAGFLRSDPAQRYARQALFFLVWSCPAPVAQVALRELAGIAIDPAASTSAL